MKLLGLGLGHLQVVAPFWFNGALMWCIKITTCTKSDAALTIASFCLMLCGQKKFFQLVMSGVV